MPQDLFGQMVTAEEAAKARSLIEVGFDLIRDGQDNERLSADVVAALAAVGNSLRWLQRLEPPAAQGSLADQEAWRSLNSQDVARRWLRLAEGFGAATQSLHLDDDTPLAGDDIETYIGFLLSDLVKLLTEAIAPMEAGELRSLIDDQLVRAINAETTFRLAVMGRQIVAKAESAADEARDAATSAAESAGTTAENSLADEFERLRDSEQRSANWFRAATIGLFVGTLVSTAAIAFAAHKDDASQIGQKLALTIPAFLLAAYLGREASQHRKTARWASVLVAQLKSIRAYCIELPEAHRVDLKAAFGRRVFMDSPDTAAQDSTPADAEQKGEVAAILREAADLARASRGS